MAKKNIHGGARKGAGRKPTNPEGKTVTVTATIPKALKDALDKFAAQKDWNRSQAVTEAIRRLVSAKKR